MKIFLSITSCLGKIAERLGKETRRQEGQTLVEYALIISLLVIVTVAVMIQMGKSLKGLYCTIESQVSRTGTGS